MSMIGNLARIQNDTLLKLRQSPEQITSLLYPDMPAAVPAASLTPIPEADTMDLDKAWHGLHFLFTGSDWEGDFPGGFIVTGGEPVGDVDVGYGPARSFTPDEVGKIAKFLESQKETDLRQRLDPEKMAELEIYPDIWDRISNPDEENEEWDYLLDGFRRMKQFIQEAATKRMALLVYLN